MYSYSADKVQIFLVDDSDDGELVEFGIESKQNLEIGAREIFNTDFPEKEVDNIFFREGIFNLLIVSKLDKQQEYWITNEPTLELLDIGTTPKRSGAQKTRLAWLQQIQHCFIAAGGSPF